MLFTSKIYNRKTYILNIVQPTKLQTRITYPKDTLHITHIEPMYKTKDKYHIPTQITKLQPQYIYIMTLKKPTSTHKTPIYTKTFTQDTASSLTLQ